MTRTKAITIPAATAIPRASLRRWRLTALAAATAAALGLCPAEASALALGKITVQSALGEPLRAEIDLPELSPAEAGSLQVRPAAASVFSAQGVEHTSTAASVQMRLQRRADGTAAIVLSTSQPVNDAFVDLVIDARWNAGQLVRSYTMLLDPPGQKDPASVPTPPAPAPASVPAAASAAQGADGAAEEAKALQVRRGDTAGRIAAAHKAAGVSLDQMLIALLQANPQAFANGNVNRLKAGAVLHMPSAAEAQAIAPRQAGQMVAAQSRDFNEYRRQLAGRAAARQAGADARSAGGKVQATVEDQKAPTARPDQLTLSKGLVEAADPQSAEAGIAQAETEHAAATRSAERASRWKARLASGS